jgi:predicted RNase H-like HicB family nuclease
MAPIVRDYTVILTPEPEVGGYSVTVPALPEVATQGETVEEALAMAREAIELSLELRRDQVIRA